MNRINGKENMRKYMPVVGARIDGGILGDRYHKNIQNLFLKIDTKKLKQVFESAHDEYYAEPEFVGKYIDTAIQLYKNERDTIFLDRAKEIVEVIISRQRKDGYLGTYRPGLEFGRTFSIWNQAFIIMGLLSYYEVTNEPCALNAAMRCADYIIAGYMDGKEHDLFLCCNQGIENSCIILQMARLHNVSRKEKYLKFCSFIIEKWEATTLKLVSNPSVFELGCLKGIEMLICYRGLVSLFGITGETSYLEAASKYWTELKERQIGITGNGSIAENWNYIGNKPVLLTNELNPNENCVAVGWMKFSADLFSETGDKKYFDAFEDTLYNHLLGAQADDGSDFSYYQGNIGKKVHETLPGLYSCCRYRGMNLLSYLPQLIYWKDEDGLIVSLFCESSACAEHNGIKVKIVQKTEYPMSGKIRIIISPEKDVNFVLKLRVPSWRGDCRVSINGRVQHNSIANGYIAIDNLWSAHSDTIDIAMEVPFRYVKATVDNGPSAAFFYGPVLLAIDSRYATPIYDTQIEILKEKIEPERRSGGQFYEAPLLKFAIPGFINNKRDMVTLVDYASAGSVDTLADRFRVWLPLRGSE